MRAEDDQFLLMMIHVLKDLESQSNMPYRIQQQKWSQAATWNPYNAGSSQLRDSMVHSAVKICAKDRLTIKALGGN